MTVVTNMQKTSFIFITYEFKNSRLVVSHSLMCGYYNVSYIHTHTHTQYIVFIFLKLNDFQHATDCV